MAKEYKKMERRRGGGGAWVVCGGERICTMATMGFCLHLVIAIVVLLFIPFSSQAKASNSESPPPPSPPHPSLPPPPKSPPPSASPNPPPVPKSPPPSPPPPSPSPPSVQYVEVPDGGCDVFLTEEECRELADAAGAGFGLLQGSYAAPGCYIQTLNNIYYFNRDLTSTVTCAASEHATCLCGIPSPSPPALPPTPQTPPPPSPPAPPPSPIQPFDFQVTSTCSTHMTERECSLFAQNKGAQFNAQVVNNAPYGCTWLPNSATKLTIFNTKADSTVTCDTYKSTFNGECVCGM